MRAVPVFASYTLAFALQLRKKHGKTSIRVDFQNFIRSIVHLRKYPIKFPISFTFPNLLKFLCRYLLLSRMLFFKSLWKMWFNMCSVAVNTTIQNMRYAEWYARTMSLFLVLDGEVRVASRGQEIVSVASQGDRFKCISCVTGCQPQTWRVASRGQ